MIEEWKKEIDTQHAPAELIERTKSKMKRKPAVGWYVYTLPAVAAAVLLLIVFPGVRNGRDNSYYNTLASGHIMSAEMMRGVDNPDEGQEEPIVKTESYEWKNGRVIIKSSDQVQVAPAELLRGQTSEFRGTTVYFGKSEDDSWFCAAYQREGINYYMIAGKVDEKEFENFLKNFLNK